MFSRESRALLADKRKELADKARIAQLKADLLFILNEKPKEGVFFGVSILKSLYGSDDTDVVSCIKRIAYEKAKDHLDGEIEYGALGKRLLKAKKSKS